MPKCGTQCIFCDMPVRFDTYNGCSHFCSYCFVMRNGKGDLTNISKDESPASLRKFIEGQRGKDTNWADWDIPLHWGGMSDPFQPIEAKYRNSYECLKVFAETGYPFVVSTKGKLVADPDYLKLFDKCNAVVQISMVCSKYDFMEQGAPSYEERLEMLRKVSPHVKRTIVRIQPLFHEVVNDVIENLPRVKEAGAYGIIVEGMKFTKMKPGLIKIGGDYVYPYKLILSDYLKIEKAAHEVGLKCYAGENRLRGRGYGDSPTCCGCGDLPGFHPNTFNIVHILNGEDVKPTDAQTTTNTGNCFGALFQNTQMSRFCREHSFKDMMEYYAKNRKATIADVLGLNKK